MGRTIPYAEPAETVSDLSCLSGHPRLRRWEAEPLRASVDQQPRRNDGVGVLSGVLGLVLILVLIGAIATSRPSLWGWGLPGTSMEGAIAIVLLCAATLILGFAGVLRAGRYHLGFAWPVIGMICGEIAMPVFMYVVLVFLWRLGRL
jgi:hypothetical protein